MAIARRILAGWRPGGRDTRSRWTDRPPRRRRPRPVADAPVAQLLARERDLAKGWLLAVLEEAELDEARERAGGRARGRWPPAVRGGGEGAGRRRASSRGWAMAARSSRSPARAGELLGAAEPHRRAAGGRRPDRRDLERRACRLARRPRREAVAALAGRLAAVTGAGADRRCSGVSSDPTSPLRPRRNRRRAVERDAGAMRSSAARRGDLAAGAWLLVELDDADRLRAAATGPEAADAFARFTQAIALGRPPPGHPRAGEREPQLADRARHRPPRRRGPAGRAHRRAARGGRLARRTARRVGRRRRPRRGRQRRRGPDRRSRGGVPGRGSRRRRADRAGDDPSGPRARGGPAPAAPRS